MSYATFVFGYELNSSSFILVWRLDKWDWVDGWIVRLRLKLTQLPRLGLGAELFLNFSEISKQQTTSAGKLSKFKGKDIDHSN